MNHPSTRPCVVCGTWTCSACGWRRQRAAIWRPDVQSCARCGSREGTMKVIWHSWRTWCSHAGLPWDDSELGSWRKRNAELARYAGELAGAMLAARQRWPGTDPIRGA